MVGFQILLEKLDEAPDGRERRAYLVSDPGRQRAEKRELICTLDLLANAPLLRRVTEQQHERLATVMVLRRQVEHESPPCPGRRREFASCHGVIIDSRLRE